MIMFLAELVRIRHLDQQSIVYVAGLVPHTHTPRIRLMRHGPEIEAAIKRRVKLAVFILDELHHNRAIDIGVLCSEDLLDSVITECLAVATVKCIDIKSAGLVSLDGPMSATGWKELLINGESLAKCEGEIRVWIAGGLGLWIEVVCHRETANPVAKNAAGLKDVAATELPVYEGDRPPRPLHGHDILFIYGAHAAAKKPGSGEAMHLGPHTLIQLHPLFKCGQ
jgi:hypothetical protein